MTLKQRKISISLQIPQFLEPYKNTPCLSLIEAFIHPNSFFQKTKIRLQTEAMMGFAFPVPKPRALRTPDKAQERIVYASLKNSVRRLNSTNEPNLTQ